VRGSVRGGTRLVGYKWIPRSLPTILNAQERVNGLCNTALRPPACDLRALEHGEMKGTACTLHAACRGAINSAISQLT